MNKEFRAWHKDAKEMLTHDCQSHLFRWVEDGQPVELMQWTGLYDRNGVKVFEGDILDIKKGHHEHYKNVTVTYEAGAFKMDGITPLYLVKALYGEVIGNIYETPNLLKDTE